MPSKVGTVQGTRQTMLAIIEAALGSPRITVEVVAGNGNRRQHTLEIDNETFINDESRSPFEKLGMTLMQPELEAIVGRSIGRQCGGTLRLNQKRSHCSVRRIARR